MMYLQSWPGDNNTPPKGAKHQRTSSDAEAASTLTDKGASIFTVPFQSIRTGV